MEIDTMVKAIGNIASIPDAKTDSTELLFVATMFINLCLIIKKGDMDRMISAYRHLDILAD
jgi:hypothetical protein